MRNTWSIIEVVSVLCVIGLILSGEPRESVLLAWVTAIYAAIKRQEAPET